MAIPPADLPPTDGVLVDRVVFELPATHGAAAHAAVESCELVLGAGQCRSSDEGGAAGTWHAVIVWQDTAELHARVELSRGAARPVLRVREVRFEPGDSLDQRYRALGLLVVSHVVAARSSAPNLELAPQPSPREPTRWGLDLAALGGLGLAAGELRGGGMVRGWVSPFGSSLRPQLSLSWSGQREQTELDWYAAAIGVANEFASTTSPWSAELRLEALVQRISIAAEDAEARDSSVAARAGFGVGMDGGLRLSPLLSLFVGVQASVLAPRIVVDVAGERAGTLGAPDVQLSAGLRSTFP